MTIADLVIIHSAMQAAHNNLSIYMLKDGETMTNLRNGMDLLQKELYAQRERKEKILAAEQQRIERQIADREEAFRQLDEASAERIKEMELRHIGPFGVRLPFGSLPKSHSMPWRKGKTKEEINNMVSDWASTRLAESLWRRLESTPTETPDVP